MSLTAEPSEVLLTLAEVAVVFAGFASVVAIFQVNFVRLVWVASVEIGGGSA